MTIIADLYYAAFRAGVEYEGKQHRQDPDQIVSDIDRYAVLRRCEVAYVQATQAELSCPRKLVQEVHRMLVARCYDGPAPEYGDRWRSLFRPISETVAETRRDLLQRLARGEVS